MKRHASNQIDSARSKIHEMEHLVLKFKKTVDEMEIDRRNMFEQFVDVVSMRCEDKRKKLLSQMKSKDTPSQFSSESRVVCLESLFNYVK